MAQPRPCFLRLANAGRYPLLTVWTKKLPYESIKCLEVILLDQGNGRLYVSNLSEVGVILKAAVASSDERAANTAVRVINLLSEYGDMRFRSLLDKASLH
jgi:hypothetical protein